MRKKQDKKKASVPIIASAGNTVIADIRVLIESARVRAATAVNAELTMLYWQVGERIRREILKEKRAEYGKEIVVSLSRQLVVEYEHGFSVPNLSRMIGGINGPVSCSRDE